ncbi:hypothetical protein HDU97_000979 [Phlyctochytrium planicorne]|nr:hypothetical protein HDU97_000979 [Phlyctochytrium planicorne]
MSISGGTSSHRNSTVMGGGAGPLQNHRGRYSISVRPVTIPYFHGDAGLGEMYADIPYQMMPPPESLEAKGKSYKMRTRPKSGGRKKSLSSKSHGELPDGDDEEDEGDAEAAWNSIKRKPSKRGSMKPSHRASMSVRSHDRLEQLRRSEGGNTGSSDSVGSTGSASSARGARKSSLRHAVSSGSYGSEENRGHLGRKSLSYDRRESRNTDSRGRRDSPGGSSQSVREVDDEGADGRQRRRTSGWTRQEEGSNSSLSMRQASEGSLNEPDQVSSSQKNSYGYGRDSRYRDHGAAGHHRKKGLLTEKEKGSSDSINSSQEGLHHGERMSVESNASDHYRQRSSRSRRYVKSSEDTLDTSVSNSASFDTFQSGHHGPSDNGRHSVTERGRHSVSENGHHGRHSQSERDDSRHRHSTTRKSVSGRHGHGGSMDSVNPNSENAGHDGGNDGSEHPSYMDIASGLTPAQAVEAHKLAQRVKMAMALVAMRNLDRTMDEDIESNPVLQEEVKEELEGLKKAKKLYEEFIVSCEVPKDSKMFNDLMLAVESEDDPNKIAQKPSRRTSKSQQYSDKELGLQQEKRRNTLNSAGADRLKGLFTWKNENEPEEPPAVYSRGMTMIDIGAELAMPKLPPPLFNPLKKVEVEMPKESEESLHPVEEPVEPVVKRPKSSKKKSPKKISFPPLYMRSVETNPRPTVSPAKQSLEQRILSPQIFDASVLASQEARAAAAAAAAAVQSWMHKTARRRMPPSSVFMLLNPHLQSGQAAQQQTITPHPQSAGHGHRPISGRRSAATPTVEHPHSSSHSKRNHSHSRLNLDDDLENFVTTASSNSNGVPHSIHQPAGMSMSRSQSPYPNLGSSSKHFSKSQAHFTRQDSHISRADDEEKAVVKSATKIDSEGSIKRPKSPLRTRSRPSKSVGPLDDVPSGLSANLAKKVASKGYGATLDPSSAVRPRSPSPTAAAPAPALGAPKTVKHHIVVHREPKAFQEPAEIDSPALQQPATYEKPAEGSDQPTGPAVHFAEPEPESAPPPPGRLVASKSSTSIHVHTYDVIQKALEKAPEGVFYPGGPIVPKLPRIRGLSEGNLAAVGTNLSPGTSPGAIDADQLEQDDEASKKQQQPQSKKAGQALPTKKVAPREFAHPDSSQAAATGPTQAHDIDDGEVHDLEWELTDALRLVGRRAVLTPLPPTETVHPLLLRSSRKGTMLPNMPPEKHDEDGDRVCEGEANQQVDVGAGEG